MRIQELIDLLTEAAGRLPDGLDGEVRVQLCNGATAEGVLTTAVTVKGGEAFAAVVGHPHLDPGHVATRPPAMDADEELARLAAGQPPVRPGFVLDVGDGTGVRMPISDDAKPMLPGSAASRAEGCTCDPRDNREALRAAARGSGGQVGLVFDPDCPFHRRSLL